MRLMKQSRQETLIYLAAWVVLFAAPLLSLYVRTVNDPTLVFNWAELFIVWRKFALFLALFLVHNYLLAPLLVYKYRRVVYFSIVAVVIALFTVYQCTSRPERPDRRRATRTLMSGLCPHALRKATARRSSLVSTTFWPSWF